MSRGLSNQQHRVLDLLSQRSPLTSREMARVLGGDTPSRRESVRRALHGLERRGLIETGRWSIGFKARGESAFIDQVDPQRRYHWLRRRRLPHELYAKLP